MKVEGVVSPGTHSGGDGPQAAHKRVQRSFIPLICFLFGSNLGKPPSEHFLARKPAKEADYF